MISCSKIRIHIGIFALLCFSALLPACQGPSRPSQPAPFAKEYEYKSQSTRLWLRLSSTSITTAENLVVELEAEFPESYKLRLPEKSERLGDFSVYNYELMPSRLNAEGRVIKRARYVLTPFLPGEYKIPSISVVWTSPKANGVRPQSLVTDEVSVEVLSVLSDASDVSSLRPNAGPMELDSQSFRYWLVVLLLVAASICIWLYLRRKGTSVELPRLLPHEHALTQLSSLSASSLIEDGNYGLFYQKLSDILRRYIEARYGIRAPEQTTEEFMHSLQRTDAVTKENKLLLKDFLESSDLIKFARYQPTPITASDALEKCRTFVQATALTEEPSQGGENAV